jgi:hypothetical protein
MLSTFASHLGNISNFKDSKLPDVNKEYYDEYDEEEANGEITELSLNDIIESNMVKRQIRLPGFEYRDPRTIQTGV